MKGACFLLLALALCFVACGPATPTPTPIPAATLEPKFDARTVLPCELLSSAEASQLLGKEVHETTMGSVTNLDESNFVMCAYVVPGLPVSGLSVTLFGRKDPTGALTMFQEGKAKVSALETFTPVSGLGDDAYWERSTLMVKKGDVIFSVTAARSTTGPDLAMARAVAQRVVERIK